MGKYVNKESLTQTLSIQLNMSKKDAAEAVHNAVVLEEVAKMAFRTEQLNREEVWIELRIVVWRSFWMWEK